MTTPRTNLHAPRRLGLVSLLAGALLVGPLATSGSAHDDPPPGRRIVTHTVQPGDTATGLAVRYHAWTAELIDLNHLGPQGTLRVGERVKVPVVVAAARKARAAAPSRAARPQSRPERSTPAPSRRVRSSGAPSSRAPSSRPSRDEVRRAITAESRRQGVDPDLALAVSWQESGWQMQHVSSADAIGAMQVLPGTATWMSLYAGRTLDPRKLSDNVTAGVTLLRVLDDLTGSRRHQLAAYYQGLGAVREHGLYGETRDYVANVAAIHRRLSQGRPPA